MSSLTEGEYIIINAKSKTVLDLAAGNSQDGTPVVGWEMGTNPGKNNQIWIVKIEEAGENGERFCKLTNKMSNTILTRTAAGDNIRGRTECEDRENQLWFFKEVYGRGFLLHMIYSRAGYYKTDEARCIDLWGGESRDGTRVTCNEASGPGSDPDQLWMLIRLD